MITAPVCLELVEMERRLRKYQTTAITHGSFYNGGKREKGILADSYAKLAKHVHSVFKVRIPYGWVRILPR